MDYIAEQYQPIDIKLKADNVNSKPFYEEVQALFTGPEGNQLLIPGFYHGNDEWVIRFSPSVEGLWKYETFSKNNQMDGVCGTVKCVEKTNPNVHGGLLVNKDKPHHFIFEDGTPHFMLAYEADWLWALGLGDKEIKKIKEFISSIRIFGFNGIITNIYAHDTAWKKGNTCNNDYGPPKAFLWEGDNENPDHDRINLSFFENYDRMMYYLLDQGIVAHILIKVFNKEVHWPKEYSRQDELFFKYILARYQAFPNVIWDLGKECRVNTNMDYKINRIRFIKANDAYKRLLTVHDDPIFYSLDDAAKLVDFYTAQQHTEFYTSAIIQKLKKDWPVLNSEFAYEHGPGGINDFTYPLRHSPEELIHRAYEIAMAGAYPAYYYTYTAWDIVDYSCQPKGYFYMKILYDFFTSIPWWKYEPHDEYVDAGVRCLAIPQKEYILYTRENSIIRLKINIPDNMDAYWMNTHTGEKVVFQEKITIDKLSNAIEIKSPFPGIPVVFHLKV